MFGIWWFLTRGVPEERILSYRSLPSPAETFNRDQLQRLWFDNALTRNLLASLRRVVLGFALAAAIGIPLGVLCGCFPWVNSFLAPINVFGRNIPIAALIPLTFALFGIGEFQKVHVHLHCRRGVRHDGHRDCRSPTSAAATSTRRIRWEHRAGRLF